jgi:hypothetical protein
VCRSGCVGDGVSARCEVDIYLLLSYICVGFVLDRVWNVAHFLTRFPTRYLRRRGHDLFAGQHAYNYWNTSKDGVSTEVP